MLQAANLARTDIIPSEVTIMPKFRFNKLVRNKIIDHQIKAGGKPDYRTLSDQEHVTELIKKISEETAEIAEATPDQLASEIADVQQALDDLKKKLNVSDKQVRAAQTAKNDKNGSFDQGIYIESVDVNEDDPWVGYYRQNPARYPEIQD